MVPLPRADRRPTPARAPHGAAAAAAAHTSQQQPLLALPISSDLSLHAAAASSPALQQPAQPCSGSPSPTPAPPSSSELAPPKPKPCPRKVRRGGCEGCGALHVSWAVAGDAAARRPPLRRSLVRSTVTPHPPSVLCCRPQALPQPFPLPRMAQPISAAALRSIPGLVRQLRRGGRVQKITAAEVVENAGRHLSERFTADGRASCTHGGSRSHPCAGPDSQL